MAHHPRPLTYGAPRSGRPGQSEAEQHGDCDDACLAQSERPHVPEPRSGSSRSSGAECRSRGTIDPHIPCGHIP
eukprot:268570-Alexandrium_andersonii.AAC.1